MYKLSSWKFNREVSDVFDSHVRQSVPLYDSIQQIVCHLSDFFIKPHSVVYDLGCATGETIYRIYQRHQDKDITFIGIDNSEFMLQKAKEKLPESQRIQLVCYPLEHYPFENKSDLILSILTIQFLPIEHREKLIQHIYDALNKGGGFVFVEKTYSLNAKTQDMFQQIYYDYKKKQGLEPKEILDKDKSLRGVLTPLSVFENVEMLKSIGFKTIDVFFKYLNFTGFLAIK